MFFSIDQSSSSFNYHQKPRRSLSRYRRSLLRRKLRVAAFRPVTLRQIDELFKVKRH